MSCYKVTVGDATDGHPRFLSLKRRDLAAKQSTTPPTRVRRPRNSTPDHWMEDWRKRSAQVTTATPPDSQPARQDAVRHVRTPCRWTVRQRDLSSVTASILLRPPVPPQRVGDQQRSGKIAPCVVRSSESDD